MISYITITITALPSAFPKIINMVPLSFDRIIIDRTKFPRGSRNCTNKRASLTIGKDKDRKDNREICLFVQ